MRKRDLNGHAFISYVREDSPAVDQLQQALESAGVRVWRDTRDLWPGEEWRTRIRQAITEDALVFIACFSHKSLARKKSYQNEELALAIDQIRLRRPDQPWLIPVRFDECEIPETEIGGGRTLGSIQRADLFGDDAHEGIERLVTMVLRILGRHSTEVGGGAGESEHSPAGNSSGEGTTSVPTTDRPAAAQPAPTVPRPRSPRTPAPRLTVLGEPKVLIVDDEAEWRRIYQRAVEEHGVQTVRVAANLAEAEELVKSMEFTVAFIDPSLDPFDHQNLDGLRVMEAIRSAGDGTGIIVITGRSRTTVPIVRDAIKQYGVLDVIGKSEVAPSDIWQLLDQGQRAYINAAGSTMLANVQDMMRGEALGSEWDQQMMDIMKFSETVNDFYEFLNRLFREFLPVIPGRALRITREFQTHSAYREDPDLAYGEYWSRSIGEAIAVCLGTRRTIESVSRYANSTSYLLGERKVRKVLKEGWTLGTVKGVVLALGGLKRGDFGGDGRG